MSVSITWSVRLTCSPSALRPRDLNLCERGKNFFCFFKKALYKPLLTCYNISNNS